MISTEKFNLVNFSEYSDSCASHSLIQKYLRRRQTIFAAVSAFATSAYYS